MTRQELLEDIEITATASRRNAGSRAKRRNCNICSFGGLCCWRDPPMISADLHIKIRALGFCPGLLFFTAILLFSALGYVLCGFVDVVAVAVKRFTIS